MEQRVKWQGGMRDLLVEIAQYSIVFLRLEKNLNTGGLL